MAHKPVKRIVPGAKTAVILCHGIMGSPDHFRHFIPLIPEDWSVCCLLLDGHGKGVMDFARSIGVRRIFACCDSENVASYRTMLKLGMRLCKDDGVRTNRSMGAEKRVELTCEILL